MVRVRAIPFSVAALLLFVLSIASCRKASDFPTAANNSNISTTLIGEVTDEVGQPIAGASVTASGTIATTDANGLFSIPNAVVPSGRAFAIVKKAGYFNNARAAMPTANGVTYMQLSLASNTGTNTQSISGGGKVVLPSGASISLPVNGVVNSAGIVYTGIVSVSAKHISPGDANFDRLFAGDLVGQQTDGSQTLLTSEGVVIAELHDASGNILQPRPGFPATLTVPIAAAHQSTAPATIPLWYFDEALGMWKEEGSAARVGNSYIGTVQHFSAWNYDWKGPWGIIHGRVVCDGVPIPGVSVNIGTSGQQPITNGDGYFTAKVPAGPNAQIVMQVRASENKGIYYTNAAKPIVVTPDITNELGDFVLDSPCPSYLRGLLKDCNNKGVAGMVIATWSGGISYTYTTDGHFTMLVAAGQPYTLAATAASGVVVQPATGTAGAQGTQSQATDLIACGDNASDILIDIPTAFSTNNGVMTFSPDGTKLAIEASNKTDAIVLDVKTGKVLSTLVGAFDPQNQVRISWSMDGTRILTLQSRSYYSNQQTFDCWKVDGTKLTTGVNANSAIFTKDGLAVIGTYNYETFEYDIATRTQTKLFSIAKYSNSAVLGLASNTDQFVFASTNTGQSLGTWDIATDVSVSYVHLSGSNIQKDSALGLQFAAQLSPDRTILGQTAYNGMFFNNVQTGTTINTGVIGYTTSYALAPDDLSFLAEYSAGGGNTVGLFQLTDGKALHLFDAPASLGASTSVALSPDGTMAAAIYPGTLRIWKVK